MRILVLDLERVPGLARVWGAKNPYISPKWFKSWPRTICYAYKWTDQKAIGFEAEWQDGGHAAMIRKSWELYDEADAVITYNGVGFDNKHLASDWAVYGLDEPSSWVDIDLLRVARKKFGFESKTLDEVSKRFGLPGKSDTYSFEMAEAAVAGDVKLQRKLAGYNKGDIRATQALYERVFGWISNHPSPSLYNGSDELDCGCGNTDLERRGYKYTAQSKFVQYRCKNCNKWIRDTKAVARVHHAGV